MKMENGLRPCLFFLLMGAFLGRICLKPHEPQQAKLLHVVQGVYILRVKKPRAGAAAHRGSRRPGGGAERPAGIA